MLNIKMMNIVIMSCHIHWYGFKQILEIMRGLFKRESFLCHCCCYYDSNINPDKIFF